MSLFFIKSLWQEVSPGNLLFGLTALALILQLMKRRRASLVVLVLAVAAECVLIVTPVGESLLAVLERRFPAPAEMPAQVAGIVVLGGAELTDETQLHGQPALNKSAERLTTFFSLIRRYPDAKAIFAGGPPLGGGKDQADAVTARMLLGQFGANLDAINFDDRSHNTFEALQNAYEMAHPAPGDCWLLVTSAWNMPRAVGVARKLGWTVTPVPVDFRVGIPLRAPTQLTVGLVAFELAVKEWTSVMVYRHLGRMKDVFDEP
jgi:uncharacterized SAM-binding protein YcdF (DUF218 family)